jgi:WD40 repeat protein
LAFSPTGDTLASASEDGTVKLWNLGRTFPTCLQVPYANVGSGSVSILPAAGVIA